MLIEDRGQNQSSYNGSALYQGFEGSIHVLLKHFNLFPCDKPRTMTKISDGNNFIVYTETYQGIFRFDKSLSRSTYYVSIGGLGFLIWPPAKFQMESLKVEVPGKSRNNSPASANFVANVEFDGSYMLYNCRQIWNVKNVYNILLQYKLIFAIRYLNLTTQCRCNQQWPTALANNFYNGGSNISCF